MFKGILKIFINKALCFSSKILYLINENKGLYNPTRPFNVANNINLIIKESMQYIKDKLPAIANSTTDNK